MTIITQPNKKLTFEQFLDQCPEDGRYELVDGEIVRILATRQHEDVADFIADELKAEVNRIREYWIVDYLALGSRDYLGNPKVPSVFVYLLDAEGEGRYQYTRFQGADRIMSQTFSELPLTVEQILEA